MLTFHGTFEPADLEPTFRGLGRDAFFVQVGAMDGVAYDPIHPFVKELGWRGILFEPMPDMFARLQKNYESRAGLTFVNGAVTDFEGEIEMTRIDPAAIQNSELPAWAQGISSLMPDRGMLGGVTRNTEVDYETKILPHRQTLNVPCARLTTYLDRHNVTAVDCMVIDTEGADWMVARQLPLDRFHPKLVYLEFAHLSVYEKTACAEHFRNHGYRIYIEAETEENFLAIKMGSPQ